MSNIYQQFLAVTLKLKETSWLHWNKYDSKNWDWLASLFPEVDIKRVSISFLQIGARISVVV